MKNFTKGTNTTVFAWHVYYGIQWWKKEGQQFSCPVCVWCWQVMDISNRIQVIHCLYKIWYSFCLDLSSLYQYIWREDMSPFKQVKKKESYIYYRYDLSYISFLWLNKNLKWIIAEWSRYFSDHVLIQVNWLDIWNN